ncbi:polyprenyl synthetase family protein [Cellulomonas citrea]|uniref:polyprenyl synthetase family protein n=1 Tax=Cellulomonas citrea TaxID=1909423 RepID=UPI00135CCEA4|nr:polyprenyl synthetase family protein [Cellulomonas citrea]
MSGVHEDPRAAVDAVLTRYVDDLRAELLPAGPDAAALADAVEQMLTGGKRLRALFVYWSWRAHGGDPQGPDAQAVARVGAALELFQASALFHDDVMDDSDTRRGMPAAHRTFAARHRAEHLTGDAARFGESVAILLGDLTLVACERELADALADHPAARRAAVRSVFDLMRTEVTVGQYLDLVAQVQPWGRDPAADEARARAVIRAKSARYSVEHPLVLGAAMADADETQLAACRAVGLPLGEAFQLRDDLLGVFGDPAVTGKPAGDDLREGKRTVLVARAAALALAGGDEQTWDLLGAHLGDRDASDAQIEEMSAAIARTGAPAQVEGLIAELSGRAFALIADQHWPEPAASRLVGLARAAVDRHA